MEQKPLVYRLFHEQNKQSKKKRKNQEKKHTNDVVLYASLL